MDTTDFLSQISAPGINVVGAEWQTEVKPAARWKGHTLVKVSTAMAQTGVEFANLSVNSERETGALPWGEWSVYPYIVRHKGQDYARLNVIDGTVRTSYFVDGFDVDRQTFGTYLTPSQRESKRPIGGTITVRMNNMRLIGEPALATR
jgi:hypothetical protein